LRKEQTAVFAIRNRAWGLCGCGRPPKDGNAQSCQTCLDKIHAATKVRRQLPGYCRSCGKGETEKRYCDVCTRNKAEARRRAKLRRKELGQCSRCQLPAVAGRTFCTAHLERARLSSKAYHQGKRDAVKLPEPPA